MKLQTSYSSNGAGKREKKKLSEPLIFQKTDEKLCSADKGKSHNNIGQPQ